MNKDLNNILDCIKNGVCQIIGLGRSNYPLIDYLISVGANRIVARDGSSQSGKIVDELASKGVEFLFGEQYLDGLGAGGEVIFRTPGVKPHLEELRCAVANGSILTTETEFFLMLTESAKFGITGSDGKTTTTTLTHMFLSAKHRAFVGGNIGRSLFSDIDMIDKDCFSVLELSSFQLMGSAASPDVAVVTNISPNHLNWHVDMEEYVCAKANIFKSSKRLVINAEDETSIDAVKKYGTTAAVTAFSSKKKSFSEVREAVGEICTAIYLSDGIIVVDDGVEKHPVLAANDIKIPGIHNVENYMAAIGATYGYVDVEDICYIAKTFGGVEHRIELVRELNGVKYYNSSIDSSPTRTAAALAALPKKPIIICGGSDKNIPFAPLAESLCKKAKAVVITGQAGPKIKSALIESPYLADSELKMYEAPLFYDAVMLASSLADEGDIVILSPACASFDAFKNFEERGHTFKNIVNSL